MPTVTCPSCGKTFKVREELFGKRMQCKCSFLFRLAKPDSKQLPTVKAQYTKEGLSADQHGSVGPIHPQAQQSAQPQQDYSSIVPNHACPGPDEGLHSKDFQNNLRPVPPVPAIQPVYGDPLSATPAPKPVQEIESIPDRAKKSSTQNAEPMPELPVPRQTTTDQRVTEQRDPFGLMPDDLGIPRSTLAAKPNQSISNNFTKTRRITKKAAEYRFNNVFAVIAGVLCAVHGCFFLATTGSTLLKIFALDNFWDQINQLPVSAVLSFVLLTLNFLTSLFMLALGALLAIDATIRLSGRKSPLPWVYFALSINSAVHILILTLVAGFNIFLANQTKNAVAAFSVGSGDNAVYASQIAFVFLIYCFSLIAPFVAIIIFRKRNRSGDLVDYGISEL